MGYVINRNNFSDAAKVLISSSKAAVASCSEQISECSELHLSLLASVCSELHISQLLVRYFPL